MKNRGLSLRVGISSIAVCLIGHISGVGAALTLPSQTLLPLVLPTPASPDVFITELQTRDPASSSHEFVELYNSSDQDISFSNAADGTSTTWLLNYFPNSKFVTSGGQANPTITDWRTPYWSFVLSGTILAHGYYVIASPGYDPGGVQADQSFDTRAIADEGAFQLISANKNLTYTVHDRLLWSGAVKLGTANSTAQPAPTPNGLSAGEPAMTLQRQPLNTDDDGNAMYSDEGNLTGFIKDTTPTPGEAWTAPAITPPVDPPAGNGDGTPPVAPTGTEVNGGLPMPLITELLPNPAAPQTDEANEYIELYNPGDTAFSLKGYTLETGETTLHDFTFTSDTVLDPGSYTAFYSADTGLSLGNSGGRARLLDPNGALLSQSDIYGTAADGQAWALNPSSGLWQWTITPTPGAENLVNIPLSKVSVAKAVTKKNTAKVKGASTTKKAKVTKAKTKKAKKTASSTLTAASNIQPAAPIHPGVLAAVAALAVGYGVYEYRHDLANRFYQFRTNRAARRKARV